MSFTLYSVAILLVLATAILIDVMKGIKKGFLKMAVKLGVVLGSILVALPISLVAGDLPAKLVTDAVMNIGIIQRYAKNITGLEELVTAYVDALISPILFVILFFVIRAILSLIVSLVCKKILKDSRHDAGYETKEDAWYRRHDKLYGALTGAVIGFIVTVCLLMPITGTLRAASSVIDCTKASGVNLAKMGIPEKQTTEFQAFASDAPSMILYACGGDLLYRATASFELEGERYALIRELDVIGDTAEDIKAMLNIFSSKKDQFTDEDKQSVESLKEAIKSSGTVKFVSAGFLSEASKTWLKGGKYLGIGRPTFGKVIDPMISEILLVCKDTDSSTVPADVSTLLNIYVIATEHGMIRNPDYEKLVGKMGHDTLMDDICNELKANPRMAYIADMLTGVVVRTVSSAINLSGVRGPEYEKLLVNLADSLNSLKGASNEVKVSYMTNYIVDYADEYGVELPENMATVTAQYMVEEIDSESGEVDSEHIREFLDRHSVDGN